MAAPGQSRTEKGCCSLQNSINGQGTLRPHLPVRHSALLIPGQEEREKHQESRRLIETRESELLAACDELAKRKFFCEADAKKELEIFLAKHASPLFELKTEIKEEEVIKRRVGRPRKGEPVNYQTLLSHGSLSGLCQ